MNGKNGAVRRMRTRIRLLAQPESMRSIVWRHSVRAAVRLSLKLSREGTARVNLLEAGRANL